MKYTQDEFMQLRVRPLELEFGKSFCPTAVRIHKILDCSVVESFGC